MGGGGYFKGPTLKNDKKPSCISKSRFSMTLNSNLKLIFHLHQYYLGHFPLYHSYTSIKLIIIDFLLCYSVLNVLKRWVDCYFFDFETDVNLSTKLDIFLDSITEKSMKKWAICIKKILQRKVSTRSLEKGTKLCSKIILLKIIY